MYFPSLAGALALALTFGSWGLLELGVNLLVIRPGSRRRDAWTRYAILAALPLAFALAGRAARWEGGALAQARTEVFWLGVALMWAGLAVRLVAIYQLGRFFIPEVAIQPGQQLVTRGLYRYLRHPAYTGTLTTVLGYGLAHTNWLSLALLLAIAGSVYAWRMRVEEAALLESFGAEYAAYRRRTWRLIPFVF